MQAGQAITISGTEYIIETVTECGPRTQAYGWKWSLGLRRPKGQMVFTANMTEQGQIQRPIKVGY